MHDKEERERDGGGPEAARAHTHKLTHTRTHAYTHTRTHAHTHTRTHTLPILALSRASARARAEALVTDRDAEVQELQGHVAAAGRRFKELETSYHELLVSDLLMCGVGVGVCVSLCVS